MQISKKLLLAWLIASFFLLLNTEDGGASYRMKNYQTCEILGNNSADFHESVDLYNRDRDRACTWTIAFVDNTEIKMMRAVTFSGAPVHNGYGSLLTADPSQAAFRLNAGGLGECPIRVVSGAQIDISNITLIVDNIYKAVCTVDGVPLYNGLNNFHVNSQTASQQEDALIYADVMIIPSDSDTDDDLIPDAKDACSENRDNDGTGNNIDEDNDGLADACEDSYPDDKDNDGVPDGADLCNGIPVKYTGGAVPKAKNTQKNIPSFIQYFYIAPPPLVLSQCPALRQDADLDEDDMGDACDDDLDGDGLLNKNDPYPCNADGDSDGVNDKTDECPQDNKHTTKPCQDPVVKAGDDLDDDGYSDAAEKSLGSDPNDPDSDDDNICDGPLAVSGVCQAGPDCFPAPGVKIEGCGEQVTDADGDGIADADESARGTDPNKADTDGDGVDDLLDCQPLNQAVFQGNACSQKQGEDIDDIDGDGVPNNIDNCPFTSNAPQLDADHDGMGDICDPRPTVNDNPPASRDGSGGCSLAGHSTTPPMIFPFFLLGAFFLLAIHKAGA